MNLSKVIEFKRYWVTPLFAMFSLAVLSVFHFPEARLFGEVFNLGVSFVIFTFTWFTAQHRQLSYLVFLGCGYLSVGILQTFHLQLAYGNEEHILWSTSLFLEAGIVVGALVIRETTSISVVFGSVVSATLATLIWVSFQMNPLPPGSEGLGVLGAITTLLWLSAFILSLSANRPDSFRYPIVFASGINLVINGIHFVNSSIPEYSHFLLHLPEIVAGWLIICVVVGENITRPFLEMERISKEEQRLLDSSPISIWIEDMSGVCNELSALRDSGVQNIRQYLSENPEETWRLLDKIQVLEVNDRTLTLFKAESESSFISRIAFCFGDDALEVFQNEIEGMWNRDRFFSSRATYRDSHGTDIMALISFAIPQNAAEAERVMVNILDVSEQEKARLETERAYEIMSGAALSTINAISATIEKRDPYTAGHQNAVSELAVKIAEKLGWEPFRIQGIKVAALIHNIGNVYIPTEILNRPRELMDSELGIIHSHVEVGAEIMSKTELPWPISEIILQHHERLDGSGYPKGLSGNLIIPEALVIGIADCIEAMMSHRPYRPAKSLDETRLEIMETGAEQFGREITDAALEILNEQVASG